MHFHSVSDDELNKARRLINHELSKCRHRRENSPKIVGSK